MTDHTLAYVVYGLILGLLLVGAPLAHAWASAGL